MTEPRAKRDQPVNGIRACCEPVKPLVEQVPLCQRKSVRHLGKDGAQSNRPCRRPGETMRDVLAAVLKPTGA